MKIKYLFFASLLGAIVACDPLVDDSKMDFAVYSTEDDMMKGASFTQYSLVKDADGNYNYEENEFGNCLKYSIPQVPAVTIYYLDNAGEEKILDYGKNGGIFQFKLTSYADQYFTKPIYFKYYTATGDSLISSKTFTMEYSLITPEMMILAGLPGEGSKKWGWDLESPANYDGGPGNLVWGNGGYRAGDYETIYNSNPGCWWGIRANVDDFEGQKDHTGSEGLIGDGDPDAYMIISYEDIFCYDKDDKAIRKNGSWDIEDWDETAESHRGFYQGFLNTSAGAILWPYEINSGGNKPTKFEIVYMTDDKLMLCYPDGGDMSEDMDWSWAEMSFWYFATDPDYADTYKLLTNDSEEGKKWTWASDGAVDNYASCWGNCGYGVGESNATSIGGSWWGCGTDDFYDQFCSDGSTHKVDESIVEAEGEGAYMVFDNYANLTKYNAAGEEIGSGTFTLDASQITDKGGFKTPCYGGLMTSGAGILMPYQINCGGATANWFDIAYIDDDFLILVNQQDAYFPANGNEATWWRFVAVK